MKALARLSVLACTCFFVACASGPRDVPMFGSGGVDEPRGLVGGGLDDMLAQKSGVRVNGSGPSARIHVTGSDYPNPPLFVIDGVVVGFQFSVVWSRVDPYDVSSIRVVRSFDSDAVLYGSRGGNGVIEFVTKRGSE